MSHQDFKEQLHRQLVFLRQSAASYDSGVKEKAIRIGTILRVMFHQTESSTALLKHLGPSSVLVRSCSPDREKQNAGLGGRRIVGEIYWSLAIATGNGQFLPCTDQHLPHRFIDAPKW